MTENNKSYIGISEDRLHHILGVARKAYQIAKDMGYDENFCRKMFINHAIYYHSQHPTEHIEMNIEWKILTMADMTVDSKGNDVDVSERLDDIKEQFGEHSNEYLTACDVCYRVGLTAVNIAANEIKNENNKEHI